MHGEWREPWTPHPELYRDVAIVPYASIDNTFQNIYIHKPVDGVNHPAVIWFHGGGLTGDERDVPNAVFDGRILVAEVRYRLSPGYPAPAALIDAADGVSFFLKNAAFYGADRSRIVIGGLSAGAYLAAMIGMDRTWLAARGQDARTLAGIILVSGQMTTHFQVKHDLGYPQTQFEPVVDRLAPLAHLSADLPPILLVTGESGRDMPARPEESAFMAASLRALGHKHVSHVIYPGCDHGVGLNDCPHVGEFIREVLGS